MFINVWICVYIIMYVHINVTCKYTVAESGETEKREQGRHKPYCYDHFHIAFRPCFHSILMITFTSLSIYLVITSHSFLVFITFHRIHTTPYFLLSLLLPPHLSSPPLICPPHLLSSPIVSPLPSQDTGTPPLPRLRRQRAFHL
jgi:hypothetical protein